jgi:hypothetical protein
MFGYVFSDMAYCEDMFFPDMALRDDMFFPDMAYRATISLSAPHKHNVRP